MYQNLALADHLDVPVNIFLGREKTVFNLGPFSWMDKAQMRARSEELLEETGIKIPDLSGKLQGMSVGNVNVLPFLAQRMGCKINHHG